MATFSCLSNQQGCQAHSQPHAVKGHRSPKYPEKQRYEDRQEEMEVGSMKNRRMGYRELSTLLGTQSGSSLWDSYCLCFRRHTVSLLIHVSYCIIAHFVNIRELGFISKQVCLENYHSSVVFKILFVNLIYLLSIFPFQFFLPV